MIIQIVSVMLRNTYTTDDLVERIGHMRTYLSKRLFSEKDADTSLNEVLRDTCDAHTLSCLTDWEAAFTKANIVPLVVYETLDSIEEDMAGIPSVTLYVPIHFSPVHVERFGTWFRRNVQPNILMTMRTDARTSGGCAFIWKGTYYDFSLRYHINAHRKDIISMCDMYTHA